MVRAPGGASRGYDHLSTSAGDYGKNRKSTLISSFFQQVPELRNIMKFLKGVRAPGFDVAAILAGLCTLWCLHIVVIINENTKDPRVQTPLDVPAPILGCHNIHLIY